MKSNQATHSAAPRLMSGAQETASSKMARHQELAEGGNARPVKENLTRTEAAIHLGISPQTLAANVTTKRMALPFYKCGRRVMYRRSDLDAFIAANLKGVVAAKKEVL